MSPFRRTDTSMVFYEFQCLRCILRIYQTNSRWEDSEESSARQSRANGCVFRSERGYGPSRWIKMSDVNPRFDLCARTCNQRCFVLIWDEEGRWLVTVRVWHGHTKPSEQSWSRIVGWEHMWVILLNVLYVSVLIQKYSTCKWTVVQLKYVQKYTPLHVWMMDGLDELSPWYLNTLEKHQSRINYNLYRSLATTSF